MLEDVNVVASQKLPCISLNLAYKLNILRTQRASLRKKRFLATVRIFVGEAGDGATPTVAYSGAQTPAAPTNVTVRAAGDTSRPYK